MTGADLLRAVEVYVRFAYPGGGLLPRRVRVEFDSSGGIELAVRGLERDDGCPVRRHVMRLGNHGYPHMKLVVEQMPGCGEWFFGVDCHDAALGECSATDVAAWELVRLQNAAIKAAIEQAWREAGLPTQKAKVTQVIGRERVGMGASGKVRATVERPLVMVVDDEEELAELYAIYLRQDGFRTVVVTDSTQALSMARRLGPSLVLLDYMMPELSGGELCEAMRADSVLAGIPRLVCTYAPLAKASLPCADEILAKPLSKDVLIAKVKAHLMACQR